MFRQVFHGYQGVGIVVCLLESDNACKNFSYYTCTYMQEVSKAFFYNVVRCRYDSSKKNTETEFRDVSVQAKQTKQSYISNSILTFICTVLFPEFL